MSDRRRRNIALGSKLALALGAAVVIGASSAAAVGPIRYRVSGNACLPLNNQTAWSARPHVGLQIDEASGAATADTVICSIPTGPGLVDLGSPGAFPIGQVSIKLRHGGLAAGISTAVLAHDHDSSDFCTCGANNLTVPANSHVTRNHPFDCGSCMPANDWGVTVEVARTGAGSTAVKQIAVYAQ